MGQSATSRSGRFASRRRWMRHRPGNCAWTRADVVRYVSSVRAHGPDGDDIDPLAAEALILGALGGGPPPRADAEATAAVQAIALVTLIADLELDAADLDRFLAETRELTDQWLCEPRLRK